MPCDLDSFTPISTPLAANRDALSALKGGVPMLRGGPAEEVAEAIIWLLSDKSSYLTGSCLDVSGWAIKNDNGKNMGENDDKLNLGKTLGLPIIESWVAWVCNRYHHVLLMFKRGKWDMPKGRIENRDQREVPHCVKSKRKPVWTAS